MRRTRSSTAVSRKGMKAAGLNLNTFFFEGIHTFSCNPRSDRSQGVVPQDQVGYRADLDPASAVEAEQVRRVRSRHGPNLFRRQIEPAKQIGDAAIHRQRAACQEIL